MLLDVEEVKRLLPHRAPFLMIDKLSDIKPGESAVGWKAVSITEPHFAGHFPEYAVMPGVLIVEAMAQAAGALVVHTLGLQDQRCQMFRGRIMVATAPARQASPQVPKLSAQAPSCDVPPN